LSVLQREAEKADLQYYSRSAVLLRPPESHE